jgi:hypothetical protein
MATPTRVGYAGIAPGGPVSLAWGDGRDVLVLTEVRAAGRPMVRKVAPGDTRIDPVEIDGRRGYWLTGAPHEVARLGDLGIAVVGTERLAGDTLIWERGDLLLRLEGASSKSAALAVARTLR